MARPVSDKPKPTILVVEDDFDSRTLKHATLGPIYDVLAVSDGAGMRASLTSLEDQALAAIVLELGLPNGADGLELARWLRRQDRWKDVPIVAIAVDDRLHDQKAAAAAGCDAYFLKPFNPLDLRRELRALIAGGVRRQGSE